MKIRTVKRNGVVAAVVESSGRLLFDVQSALDLMAAVEYETGSRRIAVDKAAVAEDFFVLSTCLAGEVLQKFVNYQVRLAIVGDFSRYTSKPLQDFIRESNRGSAAFFVSSEDEAIIKLCGE